jgi:NAD(P)-dependent dehydrogenase (short-subunit alcohol dehydrogenase family)
MSQKPFKGKVAIITGSSMGIGKAIAWEFAMKGASIVLNARNPEKLSRALAEFEERQIPAIAVAGDVSNWEDVEKITHGALEAFGRIDIVINNAGVATRGSVENMSHDVFRKVLEVNVLGSIYPAKSALPYLRKTKGSVVFVSSIASFHGLPFNSVYCASKDALKAFSESFRLETEKEGIHTGIAYVGFTENDPNKIIMDADGQLIYLEERKGIKKQSPQEVATIIYKMVKKRQKRVTLSLAGKALKFMVWLAPGVINFFYRRNFNKIKANSTGKPNYVK